MTTARIPAIEPPYEPEVERILNKLMPAGVPVEPLALFRTLTHNQEIASRMYPLASGFLGHPSVSPLEREIVILRTCSRCSAEYEWGVHVTFFAGQVGLDEAKQVGTYNAASDDPRWTHRESLLLRLADELHDTASLSDDLWDGLSAEWSHEQIIELLMLAGFYHAISYVCNAAHVPEEAWAARFPS